MRIEEFLKKITEIDLTQVKYVFSDWDDALEAYALQYKKHGSPNVVRLLKIAPTLGELVDLYRGVVLNAYPVTISQLAIKQERYQELLSYHQYKNDSEETLFERISNGSQMEDRLNFAYNLTKLSSELQSKEACNRKLIHNLLEGKFNEPTQKISNKAIRYPDTL